MPAIDVRQRGFADGFRRGRAEGYKAGFAAGLEAAAEMVKKCKTVDQPLSAYYKGYESAFEEMEELFRSHAKALAEQP